MNRRTMLGLGGAAVLALGVPLQLLFKRRGKLPASLQSDPQRLLDLPPGFSYRVLDRTGDAMTDGYRVPARPDGMGCFELPDGSWALMRNHELERSERQGPRGQVPSEAYDPAAFGGVTRLVIDPKSLALRSSNLVLAGTLRNCAGGVSPWGWLSCEETVERGHGFVFVCPETAERVTAPQRVVGFGRFNHEAACVDPRTLTTYLTEDRADGSFYRFVPHDRARPFEGRLQALRVVDQPRFAIGSKLAAGEKRRVEWVDVPDPNPDDDTVRQQAQERGAAVLRRGEGMWFHDGAIYVCSTTGGARSSGQLLRVVPEPESVLECVTEGQDDALLDMPDNITIAPWGDVYMAEDGGRDQYVRGLSRSGRVFDVARNARSGGEFAGVCFSPDGRVLFLNLQREGITVAVSGPFRELAATHRA